MSSSSSVGSGPQRRCEAWSFAICPTAVSTLSHWPPQRRCEAWSFAIFDVFRPSEWLVSSSTKVRSVKLRNFRSKRFTLSMLFLNEGAKRGASQCHGVVPLAGAGQSSTKVRSVELRNLRMFHLPTMCDIPQRRCEAWSFAISPTGSGVISGLNPQRRCEAWSFAIVALIVVAGLVPSSTKVRSVELRNWVAVERPAISLRSSTKVRSVELRNWMVMLLAYRSSSSQRRCEAWSFAITGRVTEDEADSIPQRRCEAWSFAISHSTRCRA